MKTVACLLSLFCTFLFAQQPGAVPDANTDDAPLSPLPAVKSAMPTRAQSSVFRDVTYLHGGDSEHHNGIRKDGELTVEWNCLFFRHKGDLPILIPAGDIKHLVYERSSSPRYMAAVFISVWFIFTKNTKHFLTIEYQGTDGRKDYAVLHLSKSNYRQVLAAVGAVSNCRVEQFSKT